MEVQRVELGASGADFVQMDMSDRLRASLIVKHDARQIADHDGLRQVRYLWRKRLACLQYNVGT